MLIRVRYSEEGLWSSEDAEAGGYDKDASAVEFGNQLAQELLARFPGSRVILEYGINDDHRVNGSTDTPEAEQVGEIVNQVWSKWGWLVKG